MISFLSETSSLEAPLQMTLASKDFYLLFATKKWYQGFIK